MKGHFLIFGALVCSCSVSPDRLLAQDLRQLNGSQSIHIVQSIETPFPVGPTYGKAMCDLQENVYIRFYKTGENPLKSKVVRIATSNLSVVIFDPAKVPAFAGTDVVTPAFDVNDAGDVIEAVIVPKKQGEEEGQLYVIEFSRSGEIRKSTKLSVFFQPSRLVIFPDGGMFASGIQLPTHTGTSSSSATDDASTGRSFSGIFSPEGKLLYNLTSPADDLKFAPGTSAGRINLPEMKFVDAQLGADGKLYILKGGDDPHIQVWTQDGRKLNEFAIAPPKPGWYPTEMAIEGSSLLVRFQVPVKEGYRGVPQLPQEVSYDMNSSLLLKQSELPVLQMMSVCKVKKHVILLSNHDGHFSLMKAEI
jgi:hypothetical protein